MQHASNEPELFDLLHRPGHGRWRVVARALTFAAAVDLIDGPGDWWIRRTREPEVEEEPNLNNLFEGG